MVTLNESVTCITVTYNASRLYSDRSSLVVEDGSMVILLLLLDRDRDRELEMHLLDIFFLICNGTLY
jgi:hypothetical protein